MFKNHPKGLPVLFFTEMWERFGFYLMLGIFTLYMIDGQAGGLGLSVAEAADIYGTYIALVCLTPFVGGLLADRILGYRKAIVIGGVLMGLGYLGLAASGRNALFWISLGLVILGNGLFKPNISTLVGNLYDNDKFRANKDSGFNIFYMGINIGAFVCNFVAAVLRNSFGWGAAFAAAGIGMFVGVVWFLFGMKHTAEADIRKPARPDDEPVGRILAKVFGPAFLFAAVGWLGVSLVLGSGNTLFGSRSNDAFLFACIPVVWFYVSVWRKAQGEERDGIGALLSIFAVVIVFWAIFHQNGSALTIWAEKYTHREAPAAVAGAAGALGIVQSVDTSPREVAQLDGRGVPLKGPDGKTLVGMGPHPYFNNVPREQWPAEGTPVKLISTELFQSINPFFVVFLTPLVVFGFGWLRRRGKEPSTPAKIALGLFITAVSTLVMIAATFATHNGEAKASALWLVGTYGIITLGELCLSPMGLSLVSKLSPARLTAVMMGGWFLSTSVGNKLSGILSGLLTRFEHKSTIFIINFVGASVAALLVALMLPRLRRVMDRHLGVPQPQKAPELAPAQAAEPGPGAGTPAP